jgi:hypothetical protein
MKKIKEMRFNNISLEMNLMSFSADEIVHSAIDVITIEKRMYGIIAQDFF